FIAIALPIIFCVAPVPHPNKPMSEEKGIRLRKRSYILTVILSAAVIALLIFQYQKLSLYVSSGILLSAIAALLGYFLNRGDKNKR
ncbi:MAG: accessory gene regulator B family protein, partial [Ruminococcus sp.]|nr:accessory gene regulator B family protein [Ruminococcus sp.]